MRRSQQLLQQPVRRRAWGREELVLVEERVLGFRTVGTC